MAVNTQDYIPQAGDTLRSVAKKLYGDENLFGFLQNNGITSLTPGQAIKAPVMAQNPRTAPVPAGQVANSQTPTKVEQQTTPVQAPAEVIGGINTPPPQTFGDRLAKAAPPNQNVGVPLNTPPPQTVNGERPQLTGGDQAFRVLDGLRSGQIDASQPPITAAEKEGFQMYQSYQKYGSADAKTLFDAIQRGELTPDPNNVLWRAIAPNGQATPAMAQAFAWWDDAVKRGATGLRAGDPFLQGQFPDKVGSQDEANRLINADDALEGEVWDKPSDNDTLTKTMTMLNEALSAKAPDRPNYQQSLIDMRAQYGVTNMESELNELSTEYANLEAQARQRRQWQMDQPVAMGVIAGRVDEATRQDNEKLDYVRRRMDSLTNRINTANQTISVMMNAKTLDYNVAKEEYATKMEAAVNMMDQFRQIQKEENDQFNKDRDYLQEERKQESTNARANLQTYYNAIMEGGMDISKMSKADLMQLGKLEMQAGMQPGTFTTLRNKNPTMEVKSTTERYDINGNKYFDVVMFDKITGEISVEQILGGNDALKKLDIQTKQNQIAMDPLDREYKQAQINASNTSNQKNTMELAADYNIEGGGLSTKPVISGAFGQQYAKGVEANKSGKNQGTDFAVPVGTSVSAPPGNWKVISAVSGIKDGYIGHPNPYGNSILLQNEKGEKVRLSHLSEVNVSPGTTISGGQVIAKTGKSGNVTGPHLDAEYYDAGGKLADIMGTDYGQFYASGGTVSKKAANTATAKKEQMRTDISKAIPSVQGSDGYISPDDYKALRASWAQEGNNPDEFDRTYYAFINPKQWSAYGVSGVKQPNASKSEIEALRKQALDASVKAATGLFK